MKQIVNIWKRRNNYYYSETSLLLVCKFRNICVSIFTQENYTRILNNSHICKHKFNN